MQASEIRISLLRLIGRKQAFAFSVRRLDLHFNLSFPFS